MEHEQATDFQWNANDYARNATAQYGWARELIDKLALQGDEHLLDIGCGDGRVSAELASDLPNGSVLGIDASAEMITAAQQAWPVAAHPNLRFRRMDARSIRTDERFDVAFSNAVLHWIDDHRAVLSGLDRVLKPGAEILFQMGGHGNATAFFEVLHGVMNTAPWRSYFTDFSHPYHFYHTDDYERWLPEHGFEARRIELIPKQMKHQNSDGLKGWFRTTWFPYTDQLPVKVREPFIDQVIESYLAAYPPDADGTTSVAMVRLEVEAFRF